MMQQDGQAGNAAAPAQSSNEESNNLPLRDSIEVPATRARLRMKTSFRQNQIVVIGAGALVVALLLFVAVSAPHKKASQKTVSEESLTEGKPKPTELNPEEHSLLPIMDSEEPKQPLRQEDTIDEDAVERTATHTAMSSKPARPLPAIREQSLGSVPPFPEPWQPPPYSQRGDATQVQDKLEQNEVARSSFAYVRNVTTTTASASSRAPTSDTQFFMGLGLPAGTRLRAHFESALSTALQAPAIAVVEYNYERDGEIIVPAGTKAIGHIQQADRSGYMTVEFNSLLMPDGSTLPIQAIATDLTLGPPKGKVEGKNAKKNLLLRSLSGIGQAGALLVGHGSLDQPLSEEDMLRERLSNNIGQASDQQISSLAISEHVVVTIPANTSIYVILEKGGGPNRTSADDSKIIPPLSSNIDDLRRLLELQKELQQQ